MHNVFIGIELIDADWKTILPMCTCHTNGSGPGELMYIPYFICSICLL